MEDKEPEDDLFDRLNVSHAVFFNLALYLEQVSTSKCASAIYKMSNILKACYNYSADLHFEQASSRVDGWPYGKSIPYI